MSERIVYLIFAAIAIVGLRLAPKMALLEIKMLRFLGWNSAVERHERDFDSVVFIRRVGLVVIAIIFLIKAISGS